MKMLNLVVHTYNPSTRDAEASGFLELVDSSDSLAG